MTPEQAPAYADYLAAKAAWDASDLDLSNPASLALAKDMYAKVKLCYEQAGVELPEELKAIPL